MYRRVLSEMKMELDFLLSVALAGILATYAHVVFPLVADRVGLPKLDLAKGTGALIFGGSYDEDPPYLLGLAAVHLNGIIFALLYASVAGPLLPGPDILRGLAFAGVLYLYSQCLHAPVFMKGGLFSNKVHPRAWLTSAISHAIWGVIVGWLAPLLPAT